MFCQQCGKEIPSGSPTCPTCGYNAMAHGTGASRDRESIDTVVFEVKRAAKELTVAAANLSRRMTDAAEKVAKDPSGAAHRASRKAAQELEKAAKEVDRILRDL